MSGKLSALLVVMLMAVTIISCVCPAMGQMTGSADSELGKLVTVQFKDVPIQNAIEVLFQGSGYSYGLGSGIQGMVTLNLNDVSFSVALSSLLKVAGLTVQKINGVYMISLQQENIAEMTPQVLPETEVEIEQATRVDKIFIGYVDVFDMVSALQGSPVDSRSSMGGMGGMSGGMGGMSGGMGGMSGGMGGMSGGMGGMSGGMGGMSGGMGGMSGGMGNMGGSTQRW